VQKPVVEPPQVQNRLQPGGYGPDRSARSGEARPGDSDVGEQGRLGGHGESLRGRRGEAAGEKLPRRWVSGERGNRPEAALPAGECCRRRAGANAFHAARPRWEGAAGKSDVGDAFRLADLLRSDQHRLRPLRPLDQATRELQALVWLRDDHVAARVAATNQLSALLGQHWPGAAAIFGRLDSEIALDFLERYPTPQSTARLGEARLGAFLRRHSYCGRRSPADLLARLRQAPRPAHALDLDVVAELVHAQARLLRTLLTTIADLDRAIAAAVDQHAKAQLLKPLPRVGTISLGQIVAEVGPLLDRTTSADQAAALCGATPITKRSGQQHTVSFRYATNTKARKAITLYADNSRHASPWAERIYRDARARGCRHTHAIRILARAWLRVIWACWHTETPYDPSRRRGRERRLNAMTLT
jgi:transposase